MQEALKKCKDCLGIVTRNCLDVETAVISKNPFKTKSTVGLLLTGAVVDTLVIGGPAHAHSAQIHRGDKILSVNGVPATEDNVLSLLVGEDVPGSHVDVTFTRAKVSSSFTVKLTRAATRHMADRCALYELFTKVKNKTSADKNGKFVTELMDQIINLWSGMVMADEQHDEQIADNVEDVQYASQACLEELQKLLVDLEKVVHDTSKQQSLRMLKMELQVSRQQNRDNKIKIGELEGELQKRLQQIKELEEGKALLADELEKLRKEHAASLTKHAGDLGALERELAQTREQLKTREQLLVESDKGFKELRERFAALEKEHAPCQTRASMLDKKRQELEEQVKRLEEQLRGSNQELAEEKQAHEAAQADLQARFIEIEALRQQVGRIAPLEEQLISARAQIDSLLLECGDLKRELGDVGKERDGLQQQLALKVDIERQLREEIDQVSGRVKLSTKTLSEWLLPFTQPWLATNVHSTTAPPRGRAPRRAAGGGKRAGFGAAGGTGGGARCGGERAPRDAGGSAETRGRSPAGVPRCSVCRIYLKSRAKP